MAKKEKPTSDVPYLSLNSDVTPDSELPGGLSDEELARLDKSDPKLAYTWTIWEQHVQPKDKKVGYQDATKQSASFSTAKEFWACWNHMPQPSELFNGKKFVRENAGNRTVCDALMIFRQGISPEWEDPENAKGGHFQLMLVPNKVAPGLVDELWNNIVFGMVGGAISPPDMINGVRFVDKLNHKSKPAVRIEVWFNDMDENDTGRKFKLKNSLETTMRTCIDGTLRPVTWGYTETVAHTKH